VHWGSSKDIHTTIIPDLIYDVGSHVGHDTAFYLHKGFRVLAIDAHPGMVDSVRTRFAQEIARGRLTVLNAVISGDEGDVDFWISERDSGSSSLDRHRAGRLESAVRQVQVPSVSLGQIFREYGVPYYLKIDIEGADHHCLQALCRTDLPQYLSWEASADALQSLDLVAQLGYRYFKCIDQLLFRQPSYRFSWPFRIDRKLRGWIGIGEPVEIATAGWRFVPGHSAGPFGEDTNGAWHSLEKIKAQWITLCEKHPKLSAWYDFHARFER